MPDPRPASSPSAAASSLQLPSAAVSDGRPAMSSMAALNPRICPSCGGRYPADFRVCPRDATPLEDAPSDEDPLVGQLLAGSYEVMRVIGEGGMGRVYEARHTRLHTKRFAVKLLHQELARQPEVVTRFQREAEAASGLMHPNVVDVYDVNTSPDGRPYIVAELLEGEELGNHLERMGKLSVPDAVRIVRQICRGLGVAHANGIVHRDVKPENVFLVGPEGIVKMLDFGISKIAESPDGLTKTGTVMGTPDYMAPEQARGDRVDARADIYAVGAILYRALTGRKPFEGLDPMATLTAVLTQEPPRPTVLEPSIPLALELVVQRAMAKNVNQRFQTMEALEHELSAFDDLDAVRPAHATVMAQGMRGNTPPPTLLEAAARTLLATPQTGMGGAEAMEETARNVRLARPGLVFFSLLGWSWVFLNLAAVAAALVRLLRGSDLTSVEVTLALVGVLATLSSPLVMWVRHLRRDVWPNTPRAIEVLAKLRRSTLYSVAAYGFSAVLVQVFEGVVGRNGVGASRPGWALFSFTVAAAVGALTWMAATSRARA